MLNNQRSLRTTTNFISPLMALAGSVSVLLAIGVAMQFSATPIIQAQAQNNQQGATGDGGILGGQGGAPLGQDDVYVLPIDDLEDPGEGGETSGGPENPGDDDSGLDDRPGWCCPDITVEQLCIPLDSLLDCEAASGDAPITGGGGGSSGIGDAVMAIAKGSGTVDERLTNMANHIIQNSEQYGDDDRPQLRVNFENYVLEQGADEVGLEQALLGMNFPLGGGGGGTGTASDGVLWYENGTLGLDAQFVPFDLSVYDVGFDIFIPGNDLADDIFYTIFSIEEHLCHLNCYPSAVPPPPNKPTPPKPGDPCGDGVVEDEAVCPGNDPGNICFYGEICQPGGQKCPAKEGCDNGSTCANGDACVPPTEGEPNPCADVDGDDKECRHRESATCTEQCKLKPACGNNIKEKGEECDDGNRNDGDGCSANCTVEGGQYCGDGIVNNVVDGVVTEECDPGGWCPLEPGEKLQQQCGLLGCPNNGVCTVNAFDPTCTVDCKRIVGPRCGDGNLGLNEFGEQEQCDDNNTVSGDGCNQSCEIEYCGDGVEQIGLPVNLRNPDGVTYTTVPGLSEQCDDNGENGTTDKLGWRNPCDGNCQLITYRPPPQCGDQKLNGNEQCDGNSLHCEETLGPLNDPNQYYFCNAVSLKSDAIPCTCGIGTRPAGCGNGEPDEGEQCDDGTTCEDGQRCFGTCEDGSECKTRSLDGCSESCTFEFCGNEIVENRDIPDGIFKTGDYCEQNPLEEALCETCDSSDSAANCLPPGTVLQNPETNENIAVLGCKRSKCGDGYVDNVSRCEDDTTCFYGDTCSDGSECPAREECEPRQNIGTEEDPIWVGEENCISGSDPRESLHCTYAVCGNEIVEEGEDCDKGPEGNEDCYGAYYDPETGEGDDTIPQDVEECSTKLIPEGFKACCSVFDSIAGDFITGALQWMYVPLETVCFGAVFLPTPVVDGDSDEIIREKRSPPEGSRWQCNEVDIANSCEACAVYNDQKTFGVINLLDEYTCEVTIGGGDPETGEDSKCHFVDGFFRGGCYPNPAIEECKSAECDICNLPADQRGGECNDPCKNWKNESCWGSFTLFGIEISYPDPICLGKKNELLGASSCDDNSDQCQQVLWCEAPARPAWFGRANDFPATLPGFTCGAKDATCGTDGCGGCGANDACDGQGECVTTDDGRKYCRRI